MRQYLENLESVSQHKCPQWYNDCKLGIFIHWGLYSVPAWAEVTWELGGEPSAEEWFRHNPYAEWYLNTIRIPDSPARLYHDKTYGRDFPYEKFAESFTCEKWDPKAWAELFREAGAKYVVLTTKHHDGFCLYPSRYTDYNSVKLGPKRDLVGDLAKEVRAAGLKMGTYFSGLYDWTTYPYPRMEHDNDSFYDISYGFADYSLKQATELVDLYHPSVLWNDIGWPEKGRRDLPWLFAHYYNSVPDGVVNDRWSGVWCDFRTAEYLTGTKSLTEKWEMCRGLGLSFGYNQNEGPETVLSPRALICLLADCVSKNGNLLLNIGPRADGTIPEIQESRLRALGAWLKDHGEAIYGTSAWLDRQEDDLGNGAHVWYTRKGRDLYAIFDGLPAGTQEIALPVCTDKITISAADEMPVHKKLENFFSRE